MQTIQDQINKLKIDVFDIMAAQERLAAESQRLDRAKQDRIKAIADLSQRLAAAEADKTKAEEKTA